MHMEEHTLASMSGSLRLSLGHYRYQQFVEKLGWQLPLPPDAPGCEWDAYDHAHARYLLALNPSRELIGCARLIPTTAPNLLDGVFSHTCAEGAPASSLIWEMTRFTTSTPELAMPLFWKCLETAHHAGAEYIVGIVSKIMERYYRKNGVHYERLGEMIRHQDEQIVAIQLPTDRKRHFNTLASAFFAPEALKQIA